MVIDLATVKTKLGITDTSLDDDITAQIPFIDSTVKAITRNRWNARAVVNTVSGSAYVELVAVYTDNPAEHVEPGQLIAGDGIAAGAYVTDIYEGGGTITLGGSELSVPVIELSADATATARSVDVVLGIPIGYQGVIAKAVYWAIARLNTDIPSNGIFTKRMGPVSANYGVVNAKLDDRYGVPAWFVKALPRYHGGH